MDFAVLQIWKLKCENLLRVQLHATLCYYYGEYYSNLVRYTLQMRMCRSHQAFHKDMRHCLCLCGMIMTKAAATT